MERQRIIRSLACLAVVGMLAVSAPASARGDFSISLGSPVEADPGQLGLPMHFVLTKSDSVAGVDMLMEFDPGMLSCSAVSFLTRFQLATYDNSVPGRLRIVARRHHPDSSHLSPLGPGTDTLGFISLEVTSRDLLTDLDVPIGFFDDAVTPFVDNRLVKGDSSFVTPPELGLTDGSVFIRYPLYGDVNDDGYVFTIADAIFFFNYLSGNQKLSSRQKANSDVNRDGVQASMTDFIQLIKVIAEE
ncbi:MAG: dockerin type I repeat-containing protein [Candidatus Zixiibacteriota bacterium]|nr:MAG: dockerin type I repeat-containing protein [candidate division Zixibacteria bacterium]